MKLTDALDLSLRPNESGGIDLVAANVAIAAGPASGPGGVKILTINPNGTLSLAFVGSLPGSAPAGIRLGGNGRISQDVGGDKYDHLTDEQRERIHDLCVEDIENQLAGDGGNQQHWANEIVKGVGPLGIDDQLGTIGLGQYGTDERGRRKDHEIKLALGFDPDTGDPYAGEDHHGPAVEYLVTVKDAATGDQLAKLEGVVGAVAADRYEYGGNTDVIFHVPRKKALTVDGRVAGLPFVLATNVGDETDGDGDGEGEDKAE